jgi:hypothetical protein
VEQQDFWWLVSGRGLARMGEEGAREDSGLLLGDQMVVPFLKIRNPSREADWVTRDVGKGDPSFRNECRI